MRAINIGISHDNDFVITQFADIKIFMNTGSKCSDHCFDLCIAVDSVQTRLFYIEDLTTQWKDCLCCTVSGSFCGTTRRISLYDVDLTVFRILV